MKPIAASLAIALAAALAVQPSFAGSHDGSHRPRPHADRSSDGDALALGLIGAATGLIVGSAISGSQPGVTVVQPRRDWRTPAWRGRHESRPYNSYRPLEVEPWSPEWYAACRETYRSFNPIRGTYRGFDGRDHFCTVQLNRYRR